MEWVHKTIDTAAGPMSCLEWPASHGATLLFAHANGFNALTYRTLLEPLSTKFHIIACDLRGHGLSQLPTQAGLAKNWNIFRDDLLALAEVVSDSPLIFAGHSLGATASFMAAAKSPERVRALVLLEPVFLAPGPAGERGASNNLAEMAAQRRSVFASVTAALHYYRNRGIFAHWSEQVLMDYLTDGLTANGNNALRLACAPEWEAEIFREVPFGVAAIAGGVKCPMTILRGTVTSTAVENQIAGLLNAKPDARIITIEGANHFLPLEQPEHSREEFLRVLDQI